jgi:hypothetical protein
MIKTLEWKDDVDESYVYVGDLQYHVLPSTPDGYMAYCRYKEVEFILEENNDLPTADEAKAWCESHYRQWYNALPVPTPEATS